MKVQWHKKMYGKVSNWTGSSRLWSPKPPGEAAGRRGGPRRRSSLPESGAAALIANYGIETVTRLAVSSRTAQERRKKSRRWLHLEVRGLRWQLPKTSLPPKLTSYLQLIRRIPHNQCSPPPLRSQEQLGQKWTIPKYHIICESLSRQTSNLMVTAVFNLKRCLYYYPYNQSKWSPSLSGLQRSGQKWRLSHFTSVNKNAINRVTERTRWQKRERHKTSNPNLKKILYCVNNQCLKFAPTLLKRSP